MADFLPAVETTLSREGGYTNDPADRGGETNFGISKRQFPAVDIKNLTRADAVRLYREHYWRFSDLNDQDLANKVFDFAVLYGLKGAIEMLQASIVALGKVIPRDGVFGPVTANAANSMDPKMLLATMVTEAKQRLWRIVLRDPSQARFYHGWIERVSA